MRVKMHFRDKDRLKARIRAFNTRGGIWIQQRVLAGGLMFKEVAKEGCPVATGHLKESIGNPAMDGIFKVSPKGFSIEVGTKVPYAGIVDRGIKLPYKIKPKEKEVLKWEDNLGREFFATEVIHPGFKGAFFMERAALATKNYLRKLPPGGIV